MRPSVGIDFGTTRSLLSTVGEGNILTPHLDQSEPHPSMVWYRPGTDPVVGREAKRALGDGDDPGSQVVTSVKSHLDQDRPFKVLGEERPAHRVAADILNHLREHAGFTHGIEATLSIPITFTGAARRNLRRAAEEAGIHVTGFVHEPFAGIFGIQGEQILRSLDEWRGRTVLVFDWGGGTLDITIAKFEGDLIRQLANEGEPGRSGDHFDETLMRYAIEKWCAERGVPPRAVQPTEHRKGHFLLQCESAKIALSHHKSVKIASSGTVAVDGVPLQDFEVRITREEFINLIRPDVSGAIHVMMNAIRKAGLSVPHIHQVIALGGTCGIPAVKQELQRHFGSRLVTSTQPGTAISKGTAFISHHHLRASLAENLGTVLSDGSFLPVFLEAEQIAPQQEAQRSQRFFCTDNRDGVALLVVASETGLPGSLRQTRKILSVPVAKELPKPYQHERVEAHFTLDRDLCIKVRASSATQGDVAQGEILDPTFSIGLPR